MDEQNNNSLVTPLFDVSPFSWPQAEKDRYYNAANQSNVLMKICSDFLKSK